MSSSNGNSCEWAPKCLYGNGDMILFTSHMQSNPNQKFWRCSNWNNENGCVPFLWKDRASTERISETNSTPMERDDGKEELQGLTVLMEDLKKAIELQNIYLRASIEEKREMNKLSDLQNLYLRKIYRTMIFMSRIICVALAFLSNQTRKLM
ncbi:hypothetical protein CKAN_02270500 [Cinnamomum micranthum f. kanehirae]|uniref:GRF-type domain-containing protein n=1 Tax=Cinnamomum micranthum f. kanehirae TaxID=337451 RepID=A0A443PRV5_9MAGN|nr:hypothetical protein CKAN_02270500 [Cinnamomum micranthum f. kanehirae]